MLCEHRARLGAVALAVFAALATFFATSSPAFAHHHRRHAVAGHVRYQANLGGATDPSKDAALVVDGATGKPLYARNADQLRHPASLTKMMTLYLLFDALKNGRIGMTTPIYVSAHAAAQKPTNLHMYAGESIPVETAIKAVVVRSANDVAVAIAEALGGTESHFAEMMTVQAKVLGMHDTYYHNASGLPDELQITTANDLAILARHLGYDYPQYFHYFSTPYFSFHGTTYVTHDNLIGRYAGTDEIKTGYTGMSGFNLVSSVVRGGTHLIGVMMGGRTAHLRDRAMEAMLTTAFGGIASNPALVANVEVPWHAATFAAAAPQTPLVLNATGVNSPSISATSNAAGTGQAVAMVAPPVVPGASDDEDAAETRTNEGNQDLMSGTPSAKTTTIVQPLAPAVAWTLHTAPPTSGAPHTSPAMPTIAPRPSPFQMAALITPRLKPLRFEERLPAKSPVVSVTPRQKPAVQVAALLPKRRPMPAAAPAAAQAQTTQAEEVGEGDIDDEHELPSTGAQNWTIQIGAYATQALAKAELATYAGRSRDVLGRASRLIAPFQSLDGHTLYRARFGPFDERAAREVCIRLSQRGQTCFAALASR